jgi:hypothetical protein
MMMKKCFLAVVLCGVLTVGCEKNKYRLVLTPKGDVMQRELTCWREDNDKKTPYPQEELDRIAKAYGVKAPKAGANEYTFTGTFTNNMPDDIGGAGWYLHETTSLGESFIYSERFRGHDDLQAGINERKQAVDRMVDLIIGWFQSELRWEWNFGKLKKFLDTDFRWDMQNVCLYGWTADLIKPYSKNVDSGIPLRIFQYLAERGYFEPGKGPEMIYDALFGKNSDKAMKIVRQLAAKKMGYAPEKKIPKSLAFLANPESAQKSFEKYLSSTKEYKALLTKWENRKKTDTEAAKPEPLYVMENLFLQAMGGEGIYEKPSELGGELEVGLVCPVEPYATNGKWGKEGIEWSLVLSTSNSNLPPYAYALWAVPNEAFQISHFGKIVLEGNELAKYTLWHKNLSDARAKEWDAFLESLQPGPTLTKKLLAFQFSDEPKAQPGSATEWTKTLHEMLFKKEPPTTTQATQP